MKKIKEATNLEWLIELVCLDRIMITFIINKLFGAVQISKNSGAKVLFTAPANAGPRKGVKKDGKLKMIGGNKG